ncbi:hypothetical protein HID58_018540 [Brassica napus]|uniref:7-dehydrocholesterol reductase n=1 Tax=Brassica napus TaxID=3708 RepID=A0ABQ8DA53_BRANA|nr:hypothetical protein HID58_018540 [Brassica napus]
MDRTKKRSNLQVADRNCIETETGNRQSRFGLLPNARTTEIVSFQIKQTWVVHLLFHSLIMQMVHQDGSVVQIFGFLWENGVQGLINIWPKPTAITWKIIFCYGAFKAALQLLLPGKRVEGPVSPTGNRPVYKDNGLAAYFVTLATYLVFMLYVYELSCILLFRFGIFNPAIVYDHLGAIFSALIFGCFIFCVLLYVKGHVAPSSSDSGSCGNLIIDFYWVMELYPRIGKNFDIKVFTNCRFGMMSWLFLPSPTALSSLTLLICGPYTFTFLNGRVSDSMLVNTILMLVYVTKFFGWEAGYWNSMDIAHDRAGFYICWGCLVWLPSIYTSPGMYLVNHPVQLGTQLAIYILVAGILCIYINYDCDRQRQEFRRTNGECSIVATYKTTASETKTSLLLTSGWWGLARHFHYVPEIKFFLLDRTCSLYSCHTSTSYTSRFFSLIEPRDTMTDADQSMRNIGSCTAKKCDTGLFLVVSVVFSVFVSFIMTGTSERLKTTS